MFDLATQTYSTIIESYDYQQRDSKWDIVPRLGNPSAGERQTTEQSELK